MLKRFTVKNYKNFKDEISIDFEKSAGYQFSTDCIADGLITKMLIYGRNATGKTNLGKAFLDISATMSDLHRYVSKGIFLNADSPEDAASFTYVFQFGERELIYKYRRVSSLELRAEELIIDKTTIYTCDFAEKNMNLLIWR